MNLFLAPHCDDEILFGSFTLLRDRPHVLIVYDSVVQGQRGLPITAKQRRAESIRALNTLVEDQGMIPDFIFGGVPDSEVSAPAVMAVLEDARRLNWNHIYAPAVEDGGHMQHTIVGALAAELWPGKVTHYLTYTAAGKSRDGKPVDFEPEWIIRKHKALACFPSQIVNVAAGCIPHFMADLMEYYAELP